MTKSKQIKQHFLLLLPLAIFYLSFQSLQAQDWVGLNTDNYAGVQSMKVQPASILGGPYKLDFNIVGFDFTGINAEYFTNLKYFKDLRDVNKDNFLDVFKERESEYVVAGNVMLISALWQINEKNAVGFSSNARANFYATGSGPDITELFLEDFNVPELFGEVFMDSYINIRYSAWTEYSFTYARELLNNDRSRLRVGISPKLLIAEGSAFFSMDDLNFELEDANTVLDLGGEINFGYSEGIDKILEGENVNVFGKSSFGLNFGAEFELKSDPAKTSEKVRYDPGYKFKFGFSYSDIGSVRYKAADGSATYTADLESFDLRTLRNATTLEALGDSLNNYFKKESVGSDFKIELPGSLRFQVDYKLLDHLYLNYMGVYAVEGGDRAVFETRNLSTHIFTPRYERRWFGASLPVSYNKLAGWSVGTSLRAGPLFLGSGNIVSGLISGDEAYINLYLALKVPIVKREYRKRRKSSVDTE